jgi:hypothetical protein
MAFVVQSAALAIKRAASRQTRLSRQFTSIYNGRCEGCRVQGPPPHI